MNLGQQKEIFEKKLYCGFTPVRVISVNPNKEELGKLYGYESDPEKKEIEYSGTTEKGDDYCEIVFYVQSQTMKEVILPVRFKFIDKDVTYKEDENGEKILKTEWVNQTGEKASVNEEKNLLEKFTKCKDKKTGEVYGDRSYRKAIVSESRFYNFLQGWLDTGVPFYGKKSVDTDIMVDKKKMFRNIDKYVDSEIRPLIGTPREGVFNLLACIRMSEKDDKLNHYQDIYKNVWAEWKFKSMVSAINSGDWTTSEEVKTNHGYLMSGLKNKVYDLKWLHVWDPNAPDNPIHSTNETLRKAKDDEDEDDTSY